jgi:peptide deformylase
MEILIYPHKSLREKAQPVAEVNEDLRQILAQMVQTMGEAPGIGLAGPQVGIGQRILVVDISIMAKEGDEHPGLLKVINPKILNWTGTSLFEEGCLSLPGLLVEIERPAEVTVEYLDVDGHKQEIQAKGLLATALQHEIDHLDGVLIFDRLSSLKKSRYLSWLKKHLKKGLLNKQPTDPGDPDIPIFK